MKGLIRNLVNSSIFALAIAVAPGFQADAWAVDVEGVEIVSGDTTDVLIRLTEGADGAAVSSFTMSGPDRVIVDKYRGHKRPCQHCRRYCCCCSSTQCKRKRQVG